MSSLAPPYRRAHSIAPLRSYLTTKMSRLPAVVNRVALVPPSITVPPNEPTTTTLPSRSTAMARPLSLPAPVRVWAHRYAPVAPAYLATNMPELPFGEDTPPAPGSTRPLNEPDPRTAP